MGDIALSQRMKEGKGVLAKHVHVAVKFKITATGLVTHCLDAEGVQGQKSNFLCFSTSISNVGWSLRLRRRNRERTNETEDENRAL
ncbi:unnamed protein product [Sphenostylis stenocarpa]|uniref:Uncharacterized protein n=1 Tax=Sphenostylis stenocarpa TaxID=92480 RepID=A0AA86SB43_9FABA|nr:unnamed protein product [Sphenostylis stenocarpa]